MGKMLKMQPTLLHVPTEKDVVYTPPGLAADIVRWFSPTGVCLDPCRGDGAFFNLLPDGSHWCEIAQGIDFYAWTDRVDWIVSNPPYSNLLAWIRHSFTIADNIVYLMPMHRIFASHEFMTDLFVWGGIVHIRRYGTGHHWGFPFGHALVAVHYKRNFMGGTTWSKAETVRHDSQEIIKNRRVDRRASEE